MVITCATNIHAHDKAFPGQLGIYDDKHIKGLRRLTDLIHEHGGVSSTQIHHGGARADLEQGGVRVGPSDMPERQTLGMSISEIQQLRADFVAAALRADKSGFDGVEVHGAFAWILLQFISPEFNFRTDEYGGSLENRSRLLFEVIGDIRKATRADFQIGLRLSLSSSLRGISTADMRRIAVRAVEEEQIDYLDLVIGNRKRILDDESFKGRNIMSIFADMPRTAVKIGASGDILSAEAAREVLEAGFDFVMVGRAAILEPDFPRKVQKNQEHMSPKMPVTESFLRQQGIGATFIEYLKTWQGFIAN